MEKKCMQIIIVIINVIVVINKYIYLTDLVTLFIG